MFSLILAECRPGPRAQDAINGTRRESLRLQAPLHLTELGGSLGQPDDGNVVDGDFVPLLKVAQVYGPRQTDAPWYASKFARTDFCQHVRGQRDRTCPCDVGHLSSTVNNWLDRGALPRDDCAIGKAEEGGRGERHTTIYRTDVREAAGRCADRSVVS